MIYLFKFALGIAAIYLIILTALFFMQDKMIFVPPEYGDLPQSNADFEAVQIKTDDRETLRSYYSPAKDNKPTILVFHGNGSAALAMGTEFTAFKKAGYGVLLAEYRGYVGSTGTPSQHGLYLDGLAAFDFAKLRGAEKIYIYGHSLGTGVAIKTATMRNVEALFLAAPFDSMLAIVKGRFPYVPAKWLLKHPFRSDLLIDQISVPIKIVHGDQDRVIPHRHGKALSEKAKSLSEFKTIKGADHNDLNAFNVADIAVEFFDQLKD